MTLKSINTNIVCARKLRGRGINLLAGRAVTRHMHPLVARELGRDFEVTRALRYGCLPLASTSDEPEDYLKVAAKVVEDYFSILEDLLIAVRLPVFTKRAKRRMIAHPTRGTQPRLLSSAPV